jgi:hypothetical protein
MTDFLRQHKNLLPLLLLTAVCAYTVVVTLFTPVYIEGQPYERSFDFRHYLALAGVALNLLAHFRFRRWFKFTLAGLLLLGLFDVANFTPDRFSMGFGFGDAVRISVQPLSLLVAVVYYLLNPAESRRLLRTYVLPAPSPDKQAAYYRERVAQFRSSYARKSDESLHALLGNQQLVPAAQEAARQLLQERAAHGPAAPKP